VPLHRRVQAAAVSAALLATGCFAATSAAAEPVPPATAVDCVQPGPTLRYLVVFDPGTSAPLADAQIAAACGTTAHYYPQIAVAVAVSPDPRFGQRIGPHRAYSAQADGLSRHNGAPARQTKKDDEVAGAPA
jgi:hypothetical protein